MNISKCLFAGLLLLSSFAVAQRGKEGNVTVNTAGRIVNEYTTLTANATAGATTITVAASSLNANSRFSSGLAAGDLIMIIQMQGATILGQPDAFTPTIGNPNNASWGDVTNYNNCGKYEYAQVFSVPNSTSINLDCALTNDYTSSGKVQIVRVPRYNTLTISAGGILSCQIWNGTTGGILAVEVFGNTTFTTGGKINTTGTGFRGGVVFTTTGRTTTTLYSSISLDVGTNKGEGIAGYDTDYNSYGGKYCRAAAANAGGGGNVWNCGGGGGGNAGNTSAWTGQGNPNNSGTNWNTAWNLESAGFASSTSSGGGRGGYSFSSSNQNAITLGPGTPGFTNAWGGTYRYNLGGLGGRPLDYSTGRIYLGGGGGAGEQDNNQAGAGGKGGGIIYFVTYGNITGSGNDSIISDGAVGGSTVISGSNSGKDAGGGAGAGGTIILNSTGTISGVAIRANGGIGGHQLQNTSGFFPLTEAEGPGGGGGGGYIAVSNGSPVQLANGGANGITQSPHLTEFLPNGATMGGAGLTSQTITNFTITAAGATICSGNTASITASLTGTVPAGTTIHWYTAQTGGTPIGSGSPFTTPVLSGTTTFYVGTCPGTYRTPVVVTVNPGPNVSVNSAAVCGTVTTTLTASGATTYTWSAGATSTGVTTATVSPSSTSTYTVTGTTGSCSGTAVSTITVTTPPAATFSYTGTPYCKNEANPSPTFSGGGTAGVFSSTAGLSINSGTGLVDLTLSTPGTYTVTNTVPASGSCPGASATSSITITALPIATFSYTGNPYCQTGTDPSPVFSGGGSGGTFSSTVGLSINSVNGLVDLSASTPGTYTVTNTIASSGGCPQVTATASITVNAPPVAAFNYTGTPYCKNGANPSPTFNGGGVAGTFTSTAGLSINSGTGLVDLAASTAGTYTVTNTIPAANGCAAVIATTSITITTLPVADFSYPSTSYCQNASDPSPVYSGGGTAGVFSSTAGLSINSGNGLVDLSASTPGTYTVTNTISASGGCPAVTATSVITITSPQVATFSYSGSPYCQNDADPSPVFSGGGIAGSFSSTSGLTINSSSGEVDLSSSTSGTYTVTNALAATGGCPIITATGTITITPVQSAAFSYSSSTFCQSGTNPLPTVTGTSGGTFTSAPAGLVINLTTGEITLSSSPLNNYTVTYTTAGPCGSSSSVSVAISNSPAATFGYASSSYCQGDTDPLPVFSGGGTAGVFSSTSGLSINGSTGEIDLSASTPGTYTVTNLIAASGGCAAASSTASITIDPPAIASFTYTSASYCISGTDPSPVLSGGGTAGIFTSTAGLSINSANGTVDLSASTPGTYTVINTVSGSCGNSDSTTITINTSSDPTITQPASVCAGASPFNLSAATGGGTWTGSGITNGVNGTFDPGVAGVGNDTITYTISGSCGAVDTVVVTVTSLSDATIANTSAVCVGSAPFNLTAATSGGVWTGTGITDNINGTFNPSTSGTFTVTYTISGSCGNSDTEVVTVNSPANSTINSVSPVCAGTAEFDLTAATIGGNWSGTGITNAVNGTFDPNVSGPGTFTITYLISNGCGSSSTQNVIVNQLPTPSTTPDVSSGCAPLCVQFTGSGSALCNSVSYNFGDGTTSASFDPSHCFNAGTYSVTITCTDFNGCSGTNAVPVTINADAVPTAAFSISPSSIVAPNTNVVFTDASTSGGNQIWNFGDPSSSNNTSSLSSDSHIYTQEGIYCISLISINNNGCIDSISECITVVSDAVISIPNVFTPNGDGNNDVFFITSSGVRTLECTIYDRWGLKIAEFGAINSGWNGRTSGGLVAPDGVYYYMVKITGMNEKITEKQGFIQLLSK